MWQTKDRASACMLWSSQPPDAGWVINMYHMEGHSCSPSSHESQQPANTHSNPAAPKYCGLNKCTTQMISSRTASLPPSAAAGSPQAIICFAASHPPLVPAGPQQAGHGRGIPGDGQQCAGCRWSGRLWSQHCNLGHSGALLPPPCSSTESPFSSCHLLTGESMAARLPPMPGKG